MKYKHAGKSRTFKTDEEARAFSKKMKAKGYKPKTTTEVKVKGKWKTVKKRKRSRDIGLDIGLPPSSLGSPF